VRFLHETHLYVAILNPGTSWSGEISFTLRPPKSHEKTMITFRLNDVWVPGFVRKFGKQQISVLLGIEPKPSTAYSVSLFSTPYYNSIYDVDKTT
jgi:hypothetical protein